MWSAWSKQDNSCKPLGRATAALYSLSWEAEHNLQMSQLFSLLEVQSVVITARAGVITDTSARAFFSAQRTAISFCSPFFGLRVQVRYDRGSCFNQRTGQGRLLGESKRSAWRRDETMPQKHTHLIGSYEDIPFNFVTQVRSPNNLEAVL